MKVSMLLGMAMMVALVLTQDVPGGEEGEERPRTLCGRVLADTRLLYCFSSDVRKRSAGSPLITSLYPINKGATWPWLVRRYEYPSQALALRGKRDPGLVDECCLKPCYVSELLNYC